jgi:hypothetical protein
VEARDVDQPALGERGLVYARRMKDLIVKSTMAAITAGAHNRGVDQGRFRCVAAGVRFAFMYRAGEIAGRACAS